MQSGILLTKQALDVNKKLELHYWVKTQEGVAQLIVEQQHALFFVKQQDIETVTQQLQLESRIQFSVKPLPLKHFDQQAVAAVYFPSLSDFYLARRILQQANIPLYEDDIRPDERYLMERFITSELEFIGDKFTQNGYHQYRQAKCRQAQSCEVTAQQLSVASIDVECSMQGDLYSIAIYTKAQKLVFMIGQPNIKINQQITFELIWVTDEKALLQAFIHWVQQSDPDVIIGWNVVNFDFALLQKRCDLAKLDFKLGRDGSNIRWREQQNREQQFMDIAGRVVLDGIDLLKTATYNFPSFSLENVAQALLNEGKAIDNVDDRAAEITYKFHHNKQALATYNLEDCRLVWAIFVKEHLIEFACLRSKLTGLALDRTGGSVAAFTNLYLPKLHRAGYIAPNLGEGKQDLVSPGGYVMDSIPGLYHNVLVLDFKSLYPSIIRTFCIDPMGLIEGLQQTDMAIPAFDGAYFSREHHFLPDIITTLWQQRDKAKAEHNAPLSQAIKIIMNSFYGVLGSTGCRFFDPRLSGAITKRGHQILKTTKAWIEQKFNGFKVIYGDTDSIFVHIGKQYNSQQALALGEQLAEFINQSWQQHIKSEFELTSQLEIEFETHFTRFLMPTIRGAEVGTKKRYAGLVNKNGEQKLIFKGLESVRTDWTELAKQFQQTLYLKVFNDEPVADYIRAMVAKTRDGELDNLLVYRKRLRRKLDHYQKNIPPHVKAARLADEQNKKLGKALKYQRRGWISYVITTQGAQAVEYINAPLDYEFYIERQLQAVADAILPFIGTSFAEITDSQISLF